MEATELKQVRNEHPLRRTLDELGMQPVDLATALGVSIQAVSKVLNGYSGMPKSMNEFFSAQGVDVDTLQEEIEAWREAFKKRLTKKSERVSIRGIFSGGGPIPKEEIDEVISEWNRE